MVACFLSGESTNTLVTAYSMTMMVARLYLAVIIKSNIVMVIVVVSNSIESAEPLTEAIGPMTIVIQLHHMVVMDMEDPTTTPTATITLGVSTVLQ